MTLAEVVAGFDMEGVESAIVIEDLSGAGVIFSQNAELPLNPASTMKVLTSYASLVHWGSQYRFKTRWIGSGDPKNGVLSQLTLQGRGDPTLTATSLIAAVYRLKEKGIRKIEQMAIEESDSDESDSLQRRTVIRLIDELKASGIETPDYLQIAKIPDPHWTVFEEESPPLNEILQEVNKQSNNSVAEQLTVELGAALLGKPGNTEKGIQAVCKLLKGCGIDLGGLYMENGSGLSHQTRIRARTLADVLHTAYQNPKLRGPFLNSLAVLGVDGTLRRRMRGSEMEGYFVGKTGTLNGVTALAGYVFRKSSPRSPPYIFAFIANGRGKAFWQMKVLQNKMLETLINQ
jgi:D-alanyl-D-alanine carboxypeptidase/D-alanyl-D-alanine-endopeptidase (penicillin-binding protein 4)